MAVPTRGPAPTPVPAVLRAPKPRSSASMPRFYGAHSCRYSTSAPSRCWTKDPQGRRLAGIGPSGHEQPVDFSNKQRGSRPGYRRNVGRAAVRVPLRLEYIQVSVAAAEIHALALRIEEEIVGVAARIDHGNG